MIFILLHIHLPVLPKKSLLGTKNKTYLSFYLSIFRYFPKLRYFATNNKTTNRPYLPHIK